MMKYSFKSGDLLRYTSKVDKISGNEYHCVVLDAHLQGGLVYWITSPSGKSFHQDVNWYSVYGNFDKVGQ